MNRQNVVYTYIEILFSFLKVKNCDVCYIMDKLEGYMQSEISQSHTHTKKKTKK